MLKCVGDIDLMYHYSCELAIPAGHQPPTQLHTDFDSRVKVFEIVDSYVPGYVYLSLKYVLSKTTTDGGYAIAEHISRPDTVLSHELYVTAGIHEYSEKHGPSACMLSTRKFTTRVGLNHLMYVPADTVPCVRCLVWPPQANDWPTRHRNYGWPDSETVERVVRNGCDVVGATHSICKHDEWMSKHQWRLSFSRAEVVLLNSWTPTQQFVYHMLRIFMKTERLFNGANNSDTGKSALSNYHIKTMMLWACELKPPHWWTDSSNFVRLFTECLHFFEEWVVTMRGQHYFINNVHFSDYLDTLSVDTVTAVIKAKTEEDCLAEWFIDNYMRKCSELCPANLPILCSDMATAENVRNAASAIMGWKSYTSGIRSLQRILSVWTGNCLRMFRSWELVPHCNMDVRPLLSFMHETTQHKSVIKPTVTCIWWDSWASRMLRTIDLISSDELIWLKQFLEMFLSTTLGKKRRFHFLSLTESTRFSKAVCLMKVVADKHPQNHRMIHVYFAEEYFIRAMRSTDSDSDCSYDLTNVYMAVLCYITGQYQKATDHCTLVTRSQTYPPCSSRVVDGEILPKIDDNIDTVLGLAVLYQYVRTTTLRHGQSTQHVNVFTTELFAHHVNIRHLLVATCCLAPRTQIQHALREVKLRLHEELKLMFNRIVLAPSLFVTDLMLVKFSNSLTSDQLSSFAIINLDICNRQQLVQLLTQMPIQQMLMYRQSVLLQDADPQFVAAVKTSDFMALRLYRCKLYERCAKLCQRAVYEMLDGQVRPDARLCFFYRDFVQLMDDNIVSLIGMTVLVGSVGIQTKLKLKELVNVSELAMSLYLLTRSQINVISSSKRMPDISPLADVLDLVSEAEKLIPSDDVLDYLVLKLTERLSVMFITKMIDFIKCRPSD